jgi:hypothetical protein
VKIWHHVLRPDSLTYTVAKALSHGGHETVICVVETAQDRRPPDRIERRVHEIPGVAIVSTDEAKLPRVIERLIVQVFPRPAESIRRVNLLAARAQKITLITAGDRSRSPRSAVKLQWLEARRLALNARKIDRVLYKDGYYPRDLMSLLAPRHVVGFDVHSQFLHDPTAFRAIHARDWSPQSRRPILANFLGSQDPDVRKLVLDSIRDLFSPRAAGSLSLPAGKSMFWHEYSDAAPAALEPDAFVRTLSSSDFTLCPRGYSMVTHRPIEALLRGSIPVLSAEESDLYDIVLEDGKNCFVVPDGRWPETIQRIARIQEAEIMQMRRNIDAMFEHELNYDSLSRRIRTRVGIADRP